MVKEIKSPKDEFEAFLVRGSRGTKCEGYPIIEEWTVPSEPPRSIIPLDRFREYSDKEISESYICTYCNDATIKSVRKNPKQYLPLFKRSAGITGFDYSVFPDMPPFKQKELLGLNLALDYYYGNNGVKIIPNIRWGSTKFAEDFLEAIPDHCYLSLGTHGFIKSNAEKDTWSNFLKYLLERKNPKGLIVYGPAPDSIFLVAKQKGVEVISYEPYFSKRMRRIHQ